MLNGEVCRTTELGSSERNAMFALLDRFFTHTTRQQFERDLAEKEAAILLSDAEGQLRGFSTLMRLRACIDGKPVVGVFSGDTIIDPACWSETALARLWSRYVFALAAEERIASVYWFLICSGYKTYRFLPVFFREFYPTYARPTPATAQRVLDTLAQLKFPTEYDTTRGIVRPAAANPLRPGIADVTAARLNDPHIAFFVATNPDYTRGDELACIAELRPDNLTPAGKRMAGFV